MEKKKEYVGMKAVEIKISKNDVVATSGGGGGTATDCVVALRCTPPGAFC